MTPGCVLPRTGIAPRAGVERAVSAVIARYRRVQVVLPHRRDRPVGRLGVVPGARQIPIQQRRREAVAANRRDRGEAHLVFLPRVVRRVDDGPRGDLGLEDRRHRLRFAREPAAYARELRRVHRRQLHHRHAHAAPVVNQLRAQRFGEASQRVLGGAVRGLQRDAAIGERGADLNDRAAGASRIRSIAASPGSATCGSPASAFTPSTRMPWRYTRCPPYQPDRSRPTVPMAESARAAAVPARDAIATAQRETGREEAEHADVQQRVDVGGARGLVSARDAELIDRAPDAPDRPVVRGVGMRLPARGGVHQVQHEAVRDWGRA